MPKIGDELKWHAKLKCPKCGYEWIYDWNFLNPLDIHNPLAGPMGVPRKYVTIECPRCGEKSPQDPIGNLYNPPSTDEEWDKFFDKMEIKEERRKKLKKLFSLKKEE
jgi:predicted RNA-binding Zn-ribbon protein involved in translation (DUF1610 family)